MPNSRQYSRNTVKSLKASITNQNQGGGNKKSGLINSTGGRPGLNLFRAGSTQQQRASRYCINQIGGVGSGVHQTKAPADSVSSSCVTTEEMEASAEQNKKIRFVAQNGNTFKGAFEDFQSTGDGLQNSGYKYIPTKNEIDQFVGQVHGESKRLLFALWFESVDHRRRNNVAAYLTETQVKDGMKQLLETLTSDGASNTLSAIGEEAGGGTERTKSTPLGGYQYPNGALDEVYTGLAQTSDLMTPLLATGEVGNNNLSQIAGQIYSLSSDTCCFGNTYVDVVNNFNNEWNEKQFNLTFDAKNSVYLDKAEGTMPNISSGLLISKIGSLYGLYNTLITQLQDKLDSKTSSGNLVPGITYTITSVGTTDFVTDHGAATNTIGELFTAVDAGKAGTGTASPFAGAVPAVLKLVEVVADGTAERANGSELQLADGTNLKLNPNDFGKAGYLQLDPITQDDLNPLKVFTAERHLDTSTDPQKAQFKDPVRKMKSYIPGTSSAYQGQSDVFDGTTSLSLLGSNSPLYQSIFPLYQNAEAGTILQEAIKDTIQLNRNLKQSTSVILSSNTQSEFPIGTTLNAGGAVNRYNRLNKIQGRTDDDLVTYQHQQADSEELVEQYQNLVNIEYNKLLNFQIKINTYKAKITNATAPASKTGPWIDAVGGGVLTEFVRFDGGRPNSLDLTIAGLNAIVPSSSTHNPNVPGSSTNSYSIPLYGDFRTTILNNLDVNVTAAEFTTWIAAAKGNQRATSNGLVILNYNILKFSSGTLHADILTMNGQFNSMTLTQEGILAAALRAGAGTDAAAYYQLEYNMNELYNQLVSQINAFNSLQDLVIKKSNLEFEFKNNAQTLLQTLGATHLLTNVVQPTLAEIKNVISKVTDPKLRDSNGINVAATIGANGVVPILSRNVQTASKHGDNSPNKSSFGLSLELLLGSILVTQAYGGKIMTLMLKISNENGVAIDSVWADAFNYVIKGTRSVGKEDGLDNYIVKTGGGKDNEWAKSKFKDIKDLKDLLDIKEADNDVNKEFKYYEKNGLYAFNQRRPDLQDVDQPINGDKNAKFFTNDGGVLVGDVIGPKYLENGEIIYGGVDSGTLKLVSVNYAGTATESRYIPGWVTGGKGTNGQGVNEMAVGLTLDDWQGAIRLGNDAGTTGVPSGGTQDNIFGYNVQIPAEAINISNKANVLTMPEDLTLDFLDPIVVKLLKGDELTQDDADELMDKISIAKIIKTFMEFQYHEPTYIHKFDGGSNKVADTEVNRGTEDYVFGSWANSERGVPQVPLVDNAVSSTQTNRVFLGYNGVSINAALELKVKNDGIAQNSFVSCQVLGINGEVMNAGLALGGLPADADANKNKSGVYLYPSRPQVDVVNYRGTAAKGSPWALAPDGTISRIVALIQSQIQDWLGIGKIVPEDYTSAPVECQFAVYPYKYNTNRVKNDDIAPFSKTRFGQATTTALDKLAFDTMKKLVTQKISDYISSQSDNMYAFISRVKENLSTKKHQQFTNNEVSMGENTFALFDYRPFNFKSEKYETSLTMCKILSITLKIFYQERILALSNRLILFNKTVDSFDVSINSFSGSKEQLNRYQIMKGFYLQIILQITDQISMLSTLIKNDKYFSPVQKSKDTAVSGVPLITSPSLYLISQSDLILSFQNSPPIGFESAHSKIIKKSITDPVPSVISGELLDAGSRGNILGQPWLEFSDRQPSDASNYARAKLVDIGVTNESGTETTRNEKTSKSNTPKLSSTTKSTIDGDNSGLELTGFKNDTALDVAIQNVDISLVGYTAAGKEGMLVNDVFSLKGNSRMLMPGSDNMPANINAVVAAVATNENILKSYGEAAVRGDGKDIRTISEEANPKITTDAKFKKDDVIRIEGVTKVNGDLVGVLNKRWVVADVESVASGNFVTGVVYTITSVGTTDFETDHGAATNTIGELFTAANAGTATTGMATDSKTFTLVNGPNTTGIGFRVDTGIVRKIYNADDKGDDSVNKDIQPSQRYPAINNLISGVNVQYDPLEAKGVTPKGLTASITLDPRYPPLSSVSFLEIENPLENIIGLELFEEVDKEGNLFSSNTKIDYDMITVELMETLKLMNDKATGDFLGLISNKLTYFQQFLVVRHSNVEDYKSFGSLIQKLYSYGEIKGLSTHLGSPVYDRPNLKNLFDHEGPKEFLKEVRDLAKKRSEDLKNKIKSFPQTDFSSLSPFYQELTTYIDGLNGEEISNHGAYVNIQCPQNGETESNKILPRYNAPVGGTFEGPFQRVEEKVNRHLGVGYIVADSLKDVEKSTASITKIQVSASLPSNSLPSA